MAAKAKPATSSLRVVAYRGDAKTLLAFDLSQADATNLAGFTIQAKPPGVAPYYLFNTLRFETPGTHAQVASESPNSSVNAPFHKFRWLHVPGSTHQGVDPVYGQYTYAVTPRYFDAGGSLLPLDPALTGTVEVEVGPLDTGAVQVGFTRGYVQSQAFTNHFGLNARIRPEGGDLLFDTSQPAGTSADGHQYSYAEEYAWSGASARKHVFSLLEEVRSNEALRLDMLAYDLNEPDVLEILLELAKQGRVRLLLDNAALHHSTAKQTPEDHFEELFNKVAKAPAEIKRGKFGRYAHDKVLIVSSARVTRRVLTGSTNFSVTGLYVNANHVLVFPKGDVASKYAELFETIWADDASRPAYLATPLAGEKFTFSDPPATITFAPHPPDFAAAVLDGIVKRVEREAGGSGSTGSVLFAVMEMSGKNPVYDALNEVHKRPGVFSMGISDSPEGISLYKPGTKEGVLVTGKPTKVRLPPPFNQVPGIGPGHEIHHKFVVCGFPGGEPVVYCGSSNLARGGEEENGDNLLEIHDPDVASAFAIEALSLVDHYQFLDRLAEVSGAAAAPPKGPPPALKQEAAVSAGWFLSTNDRWTRPYFDPEDLHCLDRQMFA
ncbi:MAG TPA: phospholipase D-like domain-containing protein [Solirubrobacteraceae bacterium]|nr:phospholipase D-like domain-containing protein [Solirubrobacteraceae bacterium]